MKGYTIFAILLSALTCSNLTSAQPVERAVDYLEYFNEMYRPIQKDMWEYTSAVAKGKKARVVDSRRQELLTTLKYTEKKAARAKDYKGDSDLRDAVVGWLQASQIILKEDYEKIMDLEEIAEQSYDNMEAYMTAKELASDHMREKSQILTDVVERFANSNKITLLEDESKLSKKLERADKVFDYYHEVYLVFFKSYKQENYMIDALNSGDISGVEQNRNSLREMAGTARSDLAKIKSINPDASMWNACREVLDFYLKECDEIDVLSNYSFEKDKFERIQKSMESKSKSQRTKEDVDKYNQAVNDFNKLTDEYNRKNNDLNKRRHEVLENWNKSVDHFLNKWAT